MKRKLLIVCGAPKSGTTSLYNELNKLDAFCCSIVKEPQFWCTDLKLSSYSKNIKKLLHSNHIQKTTTYDDYLNLFKDRDKIFVDCSNSYLFSRDAFSNASKLFDIEVIIVVREPVQRAISHFKMLMRLGLVSDPFEELEKATNSPQTWGQTTDWYTCSRYEIFVPEFERNQNFTIIDFDNITNGNFELTIFNKKYILNLSEQKNPDFTLRFIKINEFCVKYFYPLRKFKSLANFYKRIVINKSTKNYEWESELKAALYIKLRDSVTFYHNLFNK